MKNQNATSSEERVARQPKMNVKLLRRIQKHILAKPSRYSQETWRITDERYIQDLNGSVPPCGTMCCIGGWANQLTGYFGKNEWNVAANALGLNSEDANRLFTASCFWPAPFNRKYGAAKTAAGRARVAVQRIDHFIKTNGAE